MASKETLLEGRVAPEKESSRWRALLQTNLSHQSLLILSALFALIGQSLSIWGLESFFSSLYNSPDGAPDYAEGECNPAYTRAQMNGLFAWIFLFPPSVVSMVVFDTLLFKFKRAPVWLRALIYGLLVVYSIDGAVTTARWSDPLLGCLIILCHNHEPTGGYYQSGFKQTTSVALFILCVISICYHLYLFLLTLHHHRLDQVQGQREAPINGPRVSVSHSSSTASSAEQRPYIIPPRKRHVAFAALFLGLLFLPLLFFLNGFVLNNFELFSPQFVKTYVSSQIKSGQDCPWPGAESNVTYYMCPEHPEAYFRSFDIKIKDDFYIHIFPDVQMFYLFLYVLVLVGTLSQLNNQVYAWMHKSHNLRRLGYVSNGTFLLLTLFAILLINWSIYWGHDHNWVEYGERTNTERAARTVGQTGNLVLGLLCFPLSRKSMFSHLFGTSWEALIILHRWLGYVFVLTAALHMFLWWYVFSEQGYFPYDIFNTYLVHYPPYHPDGPPCADNFTIPLVELTTFCIFIVFGVMTYNTIRRTKFELFYWTHHFFLTVFIVIILHAASAWFFILGGLFLWFVDRLFRLYNTSRRVEILEFKTHVECTQLTLNVTENTLLPCCRKNDNTMIWNMGQYIFINIPAVSPLEWHPFSIASSPTDLHPSLFIKDMGPDTYTQKIRDLAKNVEDERAFSNIVVNVDGPYGLPLDWERFRRIIIIAGGIGITPCHSIFRGLYYLNKAGSTKVKLNRVYLIWAARFQEMFEIDNFAETFARVDKNNQDGIFNYSLFVTSRAPKNESNGESKKKKYEPKFKTGRFDIKDELNSMDQASVQPPPRNPDLELNDQQVHAGRPNLRSELSFLTTNLDTSLKRVDKGDQGQALLEANEVTSDALHPSRPQVRSTADVLVFTCGPEGLVKSAQDFAYEIGASFHAETFLL